MKYVYSVPDMSCEHCRMRIEKALSASGLATSWAVDLATKTVAVESASASESIAQVLSKAGYAPAAG